MSGAATQVVAGVLRDARGRVLLAQRPPGKHLAGAWEFPGGKVDEGEAAIDALARELREELGIVVESAHPLISVPHAYPGGAIVLVGWQVGAWSGTPMPLEGQRLAWVQLDALDRIEMPPADLPLVAALRLPDHYLITPPTQPAGIADLVAGIEAACRRGVRLVQLRQPGWPRDALAAAAKQAQAVCAAQGARLLLNGDWRLAGVLGLDGVHLPERIARMLERRPLPPGRLVGVSCHDRAGVEHAARIGADFATLSPVHRTPSHRDAELLGWERFAEITAQATLPVFALGGLDAQDIDAARMSGAQGIAAIRGLWPAQHALASRAE
ncbi:MAG: Nudix family hydrolase [Lysobacteraceae bacterium]|nr:MAG: Nudix family hydrolase [Xanthomonadaceae bacterium]